ncbi:MAG: hypothetical protein Q8O89_01480 [Nanoarchaeota archaeon]|nr:hypothetical protein [Nanoarchaeota archaeon]
MKKQDKLVSQKALNNLHSEIKSAVQEITEPDFNAAFAGEKPNPITAVMGNIPGVRLRYHNAFWITTMTKDYGSLNEPLLEYLNELRNCSIFFSKAYNQYKPGSIFDFGIQTDELPEVREKNIANGRSGLRDVAERPLQGIEDILRNTYDVTTIQKQYLWEEITNTIILKKE